jgi:hypothetical protein
MPVESRVNREVYAGEQAMMWADCAWSFCRVAHATCSHLTSNFLLNVIMRVPFIHTILNSIVIFTISAPALAGYPGPEDAPEIKQLKPWCEEVISKIKSADGFSRTSDSLQKVLKENHPILCQLRVKESGEIEEVKLRSADVSESDLAEKLVMRLVRASAFYPKPPNYLATTVGITLRFVIEQHKTRISSRFIGTVGCIR